MKRIIDLESILNLRLVTGDMRVLSELYYNGPKTSGELLKRSGASPANFQLILRRLRASGILISSPHEFDARGRVYDISPLTRRRVEQFLAQDVDGWIDNRPLDCACRLAAKTA